MMVNINSIFFFLISVNINSILTIECVGMEKNTEVWKLIMVSTTCFLGNWKIVVANLIDILCVCPYILYEQNFSLNCHLLHLLCSKKFTSFKPRILKQATYVQSLYCVMLMLLGAQTPSSHIGRYIH